MKKTYDLFVEYYDKIVRWINSSLKDELSFICWKIKKYNPEAKNILEFASWTGVLAFELAKSWFWVKWVDINKNMLKKAERFSLDNLEFFFWDMRDYSFGEQFDVAICNYNSICHLLDFKDRSKTFLNAYKHLNSWGLFIFDINTIWEFESITRDFAQFYNFWDDTICLEMFKRFEHDNDSYWLWTHYEWLIKIFKADFDSKKWWRNQWKYTLFEEVVRENSFKIKDIKLELRAMWFQVLEITDFHSWEQASEESERVYFICQKI